MTNKKLLAIDVSKNNLGLATSDLSLNVAFSQPQILRTNLQKDLATIRQYIIKNNIGAVIVGLPLDRNGNINSRVQSVKTFVSFLLKEIDIPIYYQDERYSTLAIENNPHTLKANMDSQSAMWFLQIVLDKIKILKNHHLP